MMVGAVAKPIPRFQRHHSLAPIRLPTKAVGKRMAFVKFCNRPGFNDKASHPTHFTFTRSTGAERVPFSLVAKACTRPLSAVSSVSRQRMSVAI